MAGRTESEVRERVIDAALGLAEESGWADVRMYLVAERAGLPLAELRKTFADLDAIANAWFARGLAAVAAARPDGLAGRPPPERLHVVMMRWFDALMRHREVTGDMLSAKLYLTHPHHWVPMAFDLSRLIHWFLDAARIASTGRRRQLAEIGLTLIFLSTLRIWLRGDDRERVSRYLSRRLESADRWLARLG